MRVRSLAPIVWVLAGLAVWVAGRSERSANVSSDTSQQRVSSDDTLPAPVTRAVSATPRARAPGRAARVLDSRSSVPAAPVPAAFPSNLSEAKLTPYQLSLLERFSPAQRVIYDYKLGLLSRARECVAELGAIEGKVTLFFHFAIDATSGVGRGTGADLTDSSLARELDADVLACLRKAHAAAELPLPRGEAEGAFHWSTDIALPLDEDPAYELFALADEGNEMEEEE